MAVVKEEGGAVIFVLGGAAVAAAVLAALRASASKSLPPAANGVEDFREAAQLGPFREFAQRIGIHDRFLELMTEKKPETLCRTFKFRVSRRGCEGPDQARPMLAQGAPRVPATRGDL